MTSDVKLASQMDPVWPKACVACGRPEPGSALTTKIKTVHYASTINVALIREYFRGKRVRVPACAGCVVALKWAKRTDWLVYTGAGLFAVVLFWMLDIESGSSWPLWGTALAIVAPWIGYRVFVKPLAFDTTVSGEQITYEFARADFAEDFAAKNGAQVE